MLICSSSFLAGTLPLSLSLTPSQLRLISTVGMGVLVGTSLIIIIPEGVETLYSARSKSPSHVKRHLSSYPLESRWPLVESHTWMKREAADVNPFLTPGPVVADKLDAPPLTPTQPGAVGALNDEFEVGNPGKGVGNGQEHAEKEHHDESHHAWMGIALISGFVLMFLIDKLPHCIAASKPNAQPYHISLTNLGRRFNRAASVEEDSESFQEGRSESHKQSRSFATTTGLVIHAAADGIALGASSSASTAGLSFVIFFAIMVHKAPAAFGLTSVLLKQGLSTRAARSHLLLFSLAAPAGALLTWVLAHVLGASTVHNVETTKWWTGMLLLFSGGTFLYVAMHTMQENSPDHGHQADGQSNGVIDGREAARAEQGRPIRDLLAACFGMILPLFLQVGHAH